jgi:hypothetical protein
VPHRTLPWVHSNWWPLIGYDLEITHLTHGWICFCFKTPEDCTLILERLWTLDGGSIMLKRWRISFDPTQDYFRHRHFWVLLPGLPLHFWNLKALESIDNALGRFICVEPQSLKSSNKKMAKVMVELDIHDGLLETIDIEWRGHIIRQKLDYLGIPFRCTLCRKTGHLRAACTGLFDEEQDEETMLDLATGWTLQTQILFLLTLFLRILKNQSTLVHLLVSSKTYVPLFLTHLLLWNYPT